MLSKGVNVAVWIREDSHEATRVKNPSRRGVRRVDALDRICAKKGGGLEPFARNHLKGREAPSD
jgi:hypothetical protein